MIWHPFFVLYTAVLQGLNSALPPWTITLGTSSSGAGTTDNGIIWAFMSTCASLDRFIPIHDGLAIWLGVIMLYIGAMWIVKGVFKLVSWIPTIGGGG